MCGWFFDEFSDLYSDLVTKHGERDDDIIKSGSESLPDAANNGQDVECKFVVGVCTCLCVCE